MTFSFFHFFNFEPMPHIQFFALISNLISNFMNCLLFYLILLFVLFIFLVWGHSLGSYVCYPSMPDALYSFAALSSTNCPHAGCTASWPRGPPVSAVRNSEHENGHSMKTVGITTKIIQFTKAIIGITRKSV